MKKMIGLLVAAILLFTVPFVAQTPQSQAPQREQLTAEAVFEGVRKDIGECSVDKSTAQAALRIEAAYSKKLEVENAQLKKELAALKAPPKSSN